MDDFLDYEIVLQGFTVTIRSTEEPDVFHVELAESGNQVYEGDIPVDMEAEEGEEILVEDVLTYAGQAAIDLFEAERGTLGEGAGATMAKKQASLWDINNHEEWFLKFKGTGFVEQAAGLLEQKLNLQLERNLADDPTAELYTEKTKVEYEMAMLNLERLKECDSKTVIIIQGSRVEGCCVDSTTELLEEYLCKFISDKREDQALKLVKDYLDIEQALNVTTNNESDYWTRECEIDNLMEDLSLQLLQQNVMEVQPEEGAEALPNMAADMTELMEGVSLDVPLGEMSAKSAQLEAEEMGEMREGLDPAEVPECLTWGEGQQVKLKNDVKQNMWGGMSKTFPKGTQVTVDSLYDRHGDYYQVRTEDDAKLFKAKWSDLEK